MNRKRLETLAASLNQELAPATFLDHMDAANRGEPKPRWTLNPIGNNWADRVKRCGTLAEVAEELDHIESAKA